MPIPKRGPTSRNPGLTGADPPARPKLWVEGRQHPKFNLKAWARVSLTITRRNLGPRMDAGATRTQRFGQSVLHGERRPDLTWMGRAARAVPSHQSVGACVTAAAQLLAEAREIVLPAPAAEDPIACPNLIPPDFARHGDGPACIPRRRRADIPPPRPAAPIPATGDERTLRRIRALISETDAAARSIRPAQAMSRAEPNARHPAPPGFLQKLRRAAVATIWRGAVATLAWALTGLCLPYGCVKATLFHLDGGDLRDWT